MGPIVKAQLGLERAGEGKVIENFATAYNEGKFTTGDLYFQKFASGTDNLMKKSTSSFRFRPGVKGYWCDFDEQVPLILIRIRIQSNLI